MYKAVAQLVIVYVIERWMVMGDMLKFLKGSHKRAAQRITGLTEKRGTVG